MRNLGNSQGREPPTFWIIYQLTTTHNENINNNSNLSIVNLGICEDYLKEFCNIDKNLSLLLFKLEYYNPDYKIPLIEF